MTTDLFHSIVTKTTDERVELGASFKELLNTWLQLGMSRYVARNGTLSDGHEKITKAQRYAQAIKEMYVISNEIRMQKANAMEAKADLLDAEEELTVVKKLSEKLRAEARKFRAQERLKNCLVSIEDSLRVLDEFNKVRAELEFEVLSQYKSLEEAEPDNWRAVAKYRAIKRGMGIPEQMTHLPIPQEEKAKLAIELNCPEMAAWAMSENEALMDRISEDMKKVSLLAENGL